MSEYTPIWIGLIIFFAIAWKMGAHTTLLAALDARAVRIAAELAEAKRLREEAEGIAAEYRKLRAGAEKEAQDIVTAAKADAERLAAEEAARREAERLAAEEAARREAERD